MKRKILTILGFISISGISYAQNWQKVAQTGSQLRQEVEVKQSYSMDLQLLRSKLSHAVETGVNAKGVIITMPTVDRKTERFEVYSNPVMEKSLADKYQLGSYVGVGVDDPSKYIRFSTSPTELQSMIIKDGKFQFIEPITSDKKVYGVFNKTKRTSTDYGFSCTTEENNPQDIKKLIDNGRNKFSNIDITKRPAANRYVTYRLALSVTREYTQRYGGVPGALAQMNNTMTRVNGVFEKEFAIKLLIRDLPGIIFTDPENDPYSPPDRKDNWSRELQNTLTRQVGNDNYDIGHLFANEGGGGSAGCIGCICTNPTILTPLGKGSGYTAPGRGAPQGDAFDIDFVAHEMGHQIGARHTFSHVSEGSGYNIEPGGGTTIMAYAGITFENVQQNTDAYFHYASINQILNNLESNIRCGTGQNITENTAPVISALTAYTIPKGTAYFLEASAADAENDPITYNWEQIDSVGETNSIAGDSGWGYNIEGSIARSYFGTQVGKRYFPKLESVMDGILTDKRNWETVSFVPRVLRYAVSVRDQNRLRPLLSSAETTVTVGNDGPFTFIGLTPSTTLYKNTENTISWSVANTNTAPYSVSNVKIDYTSDNGETWTDLVATTPNTGSYRTQIPSNLTGSIKLRITALNNIFYAVSPAIKIENQPSVNNNIPSALSANDKDITRKSAIISWNKIPGATYSVNYRKLGDANWITQTKASNFIRINDSLNDDDKYELKVASIINTVVSDFSEIYSFATKGYTATDYCMLNTGDSYTGAITRVRLNDVNYTDGSFKPYKNVSIQPSQVITLEKGRAYTINIASTARSDTGMTYNAWIDFNKNGVFDASEKIVSSPVAGFGLNNNQNFIFTVPQDAIGDNKTVILRVATAPRSLISACGGIVSGGIMDLAVKIRNPVAINDINNIKSEIAVYPDPADNFINVKNLKADTNYKIYSFDGKLVKSGNVKGETINVSSLPKGLYIISFTDGEKTYHSKFIKN